MESKLYESKTIVKLLKHSGLTFEQEMVAYDAILEAVFYGINKMNSIALESIEERYK
jgi:hypothetical protein